MTKIYLLLVFLLLSNVANAGKKENESCKELQKQMNVLEEKLKDVTSRLEELEEGTSGQQSTGQTDFVVVDSNGKFVGWLLDREIVAMKIGDMYYHVYLTRWGFNLRRILDLVFLQPNCMGSPYMMIYDFDSSPMLPAYVINECELCDMSKMEENAGIFYVGEPCPESCPDSGSEILFIPGETIYAEASSHTRVDLLPEKECKTGSPYNFTDMSGNPLSVLPFAEYIPVMNLTEEFAPPFSVVDAP